MCEKKFEPFYLKKLPEKKENALKKPTIIIKNFFRRKKITFNTKKVNNLQYKNIFNRFFFNKLINLSNQHIYIKFQQCYVIFLALRNSFKNFNISLCKNYRDFYL